MRPLLLRYATRRSFAGGAWTLQKSDVNSDEVNITKEVRERKQELIHANVNPYPRLKPVSPWIDTPATIDEMKCSEGDTVDFDGILPGPVAGRIMSIRLSGKKLVFFDLQSGLQSMQLMLNYAALEDPKPSQDEFQSHCRLLRRGDHIVVEAKACKTRDGDPSLQALSMPILQSPCVQRFPVSSGQVPSELDSDAASARHVEMLTSPHAHEMIIYRADLLTSMRSFFSGMQFIEVQTPILTRQAGGATARPFETSATEFSHRKLALRVAPELWLKRLVIGGMPKIFEIGPCFRNEGLDKTHNPEFTTCEFYATYWTLSKLKHTTEDLLRHLVRNMTEIKTTKLLAEDQLVLDIRSSDTNSLNTGENLKPFATIDFIPALNTRLGVELPNLASPTARDEVLEIFREKEIPLPHKPTLPRLLDELSSHFFEPHCHEPTWIENIPECLSALSKSFIHPTAPNNQPVAARAELFIRGKEVVNCYEEENNPFEQRRKFVEQQKYARDPDSGQVDDEAMKIDEEYIRALEWGLPPTGGWGMGIDRLLMLLTGKDKIADVLTFGNLRAVTRGAEKWEKAEDKKDTNGK